MLPKCLVGKSYHHGNKNPQLFQTRGQEKQIQKPIPIVYTDSISLFEKSIFFLSFLSFHAPNKTITSVDHRLFVSQVCITSVVEQQTKFQFLFSVCCVRSCTKGIYENVNRALVLLFRFNIGCRNKNKIKKQILRVARRISHLSLSET